MTDKVEQDPCALQHGAVCDGQGRARLVGFAQRGRCMCMEGSISFLQHWGNVTDKEKSVLMIQSNFMQSPASTKRTRNADRFYQKDRKA